MVDGATYFAWFVLALLFFIAVALIVWLGSLPKKIALGRNHPQVDAINALSWFGLLLGGVGWVIAFVWALLRSGPMGHGQPSDVMPLGNRLEQLQEENGTLKAKVVELERQLSKAINQGNEK